MWFKLFSSGSPLFQVVILVITSCLRCASLLKLFFGFLTRFFENLF